MYEDSVIARIDLGQAAAAKAQFPGIVYSSQDSGREVDNLGEIPRCQR